MLKPDQNARKNMNLPYDAPAGALIRVRYCHKTNMTDAIKTLVHEVTPSRSWQMLADRAYDTFMHLYAGQPEINCAITYVPPLATSGVATENWLHTGFNGQDGLSRSASQEMSRFLQAQEIKPDPLKAAADVSVRFRGSRAAFNLTSL